MDLALRRYRLVSSLAVLVTGLALGLAASTKPELAIAASAGILFIVVAVRSLPAAFCIFVLMTFFDRGTTFLQSGASRS